ncbi:MAG: desulfoferrodoxin family protein [Candidatus Enteromonas sp.]|nr:desulfoferrodoxin family protein [Candidatus Enteromonas sp.]
MKFYRCLACGSIVAKINSVGESPWCCGKPMMEIKPGVTEAATEKHIPVITRNGNEVTATVGSVLHPMDPDHYIEWIYFETCCGGTFRFLKPGDAPKASILLREGEKFIAAYAYCNKHGLWEGK